MFGKPQSQSQNGLGTALQAGNDISLTVNQGISYSDARSIALDVCKANLLEFQGIAMELAQARAEAVTEKFLQKLREEYSQGLQQAQTPDFQDALFTVQKEYAKAGDEELADLLVDLLLDRTKENDRNLMRLVLNESLHTVPKLPHTHVAALSIIFLLRYVQFNTVTSLPMLAAVLMKFASPVMGKYTTNPSTFAHLEFTGCGTVSMGSTSLENIFLSCYTGLFSGGFDRARLAREQVAPALEAALVIPCVNDKTKFQLAPLRLDVLERELTALRASPEDAVKMRNLYAEAKMTGEQVRTKIVAVAPFLKDVFTAWGSTSMQNFNLTSVGMAIGHANIKRHVGEFAPLSIWVN